MARPLSAIAIALLLALPAAPARAQQAMTQAELLDCAVFAAAVAGGNPDQELSNGAGFFMSWLIGRYEGVTQTEIDAAMKRRSATITQDELNRLQPGCVAHMMAFGERMKKLGGEITAQAAAARK